MEKLDKQQQNNKKKGGKKNNNDVSVSSKAESQSQYEDEFGNFTNKKREYLQEVIRDRNGEF